MEKGDFEPSEKETALEKDSNLDTDDKQPVEKSGLESLLNEQESLKIINIDSSTQRFYDEEQRCTNEVGQANNVCSSQITSTQNNCSKKSTFTTSKIIRYDRKFLLACKDSPFTINFPAEIEQFQDILIPITIPRRPVSARRKPRRMSPNSDAKYDEPCQQPQSETTYGSDVQNFSTDEGDSLTREDGDGTELLDFDFLLNDIVDQKKDNLRDCVVSDRECDRVVRNRLSPVGDIDRDFEIADGRAQDLTVSEEQNDIDIEGGEGQHELTELNIPTDVDEINEEDKDISLREYQKELAREGSEGENVIVVAPTGTGKTRVACSIMQANLRRQKRLGNIGKVVFLVQNEALAFQQGEECSKLLPAYRTIVITGSVQRDKKQFLKDFIYRRDILVVTVQVLLNALKHKEVDNLTTFSMIVFDECHHTNNLHHFNEIMSKYMDLKLREKLDTTCLPQILGLTASLGVKGQTDARAAMNHMKGLLANLDAKYLCTVKENMEELKQYENNPKEEIITAKNREEDKFKEAIIQIMDSIDGYMRNHCSMTDIPEKDKLLTILRHLTSSRGTEQFLQWRSEFKDAIAKVKSDATRRMLNPCRLHLEVYNKALLVHADARIKDAEAILGEFMAFEMQIDQEDETDRMLIAHYKDLKTRDFSNEPENPKLLEMQILLLNDLGSHNDDARAIVFVKSRELAKALIHWMHEEESLKTLNAREFVGQVASAAQGGMTKFGQKDVLEYFKNGHHKVIVATSVAEEGLDIRKCNLVIRYEFVTNEIVRLQSRGRARAQNSKYYVLTTEGSWIVEKERKNAMLERLMNYIVPELQAQIKKNPNDWEAESYKIQEEQKCLEELRKEQMEANATDDDMEFRCLNCSRFICMSSDIRAIQGSHHVVINEEVNERLVSHRGRNPVLLKDDIMSHGVIFCGNPKCQRELGGICEYRLVEFPLIKIKHFMVVDKNDAGQYFNKWKKKNFDIEQFDIDDLKEVVRKRRSLYKEN